MFSGWTGHRTHLENGYLKHHRQCAGLHCRASDLAGLGRALSICISDDFPGGADAAGERPHLEGPTYAHTFARWTLIIYCFKSVVCLEWGYSFREKQLFEFFSPHSAHGREPIEERLVNRPAVGVH